MWFGMVGVLVWKGKREKGKGGREVKRREGWRRGKTGNNTHTHLHTHTASNSHLFLYRGCSSHNGPIPSYPPRLSLLPRLPRLPQSIPTYPLLSLTLPFPPLPYSLLHSPLLSPTLHLHTHTPSQSLYPSIPLSLHPFSFFSSFFFFPLSRAHLLTPLQF